MTKINNITYSEYLHLLHGMKEMNGPENGVMDMGFNLSDFLTEPRSPFHVLRLSPYMKEKWGETMRAELVGLFDSDTDGILGDQSCGILGVLHVSQL